MTFFFNVCVIVSGVSTNSCPWDGSCTTCQNQCQEYSKRCPTDISVTIDVDKKESPIYNKIGKHIVIYLLLISNVTWMRAVGRGTCGNIDVAMVAVACRENYCFPFSSFIMKYINQS